jgi:hypothetical protein
MKLEDGRWTLKWQLVLRNVSSWCIVMTSCFFISKYTWNISLIFASLKSFHFYYIVSAVQASIAANTWVVSGASQTKSKFMAELILCMLGGIWNVGLYRPKMLEFSACVIISGMWVYAVQKCFVFQQSFCSFLDSGFRALAPDLLPLGFLLIQQNSRTFCQGSSISLVCLTLIFTRKNQHLESDYR